MHALLRRQLAKAFGRSSGLPEEFAAFVSAVDEAYAAFDTDRLMLERSLELSSKELLQSNADMRAVLRAFPDLFFRLDENGIILDVRGGETDLVAPPDRLVGRPFDQTGDPRLARPFREAIVKARETSSVARIEYALEIRERESVFEARFLPLLGRQILVVVRNITERAQAERSLEHTVSLLTATLESTADGILVVGRDGRVVNHNARFLEMWKIPREIAASGDDEVLLSHVVGQLADPDAFLEKVRALYESPGAESLDTLHFRDGRVFERYSKPQEVGGEYVGRVWSFRDVTAETRSAEALAAQRAFLRQVIDLDPSFVFAKDRAGRFTLVNRAVAEAYGTTVENLVGKTDADFNPNQEEVEQFRKADLEVIDSGMEKRILEEVITDASGKQRWLQTIKRPIVGRDGRADQVLGVATDITERRRLGEQLLQSQKMEAIGLLAGGVAHDFNNLLNVITGYSELALERLPEPHPTRDSLTKVVAAAVRAAELTKKLLAFSRRQVLQVKRFDVNDVLDDFAKMLARIVGEDIDMQILRPAGSLWVAADPSQFEQILLNLSTNARHAMPLGGRLVLETSRESLDEDAASAQAGTRPGEYAVLRVSDTGVGMDAETLDRIFEPFFTTKADGTGLGLATVYGIVRQHGGYVSVRSEPGRGSTFGIFLPIAESAVEADVPAAPSARPTGDETVLVVEDEPTLREFVTISLTDLGYRVLAASGGEEALEIFAARRREIAIVILDVVMPKLSGPVVYRRMKTIDPGVRAIFMSGYAPESAGVEEIVSKDAVPFLSKPCSARVLAAAIRDSLDGLVSPR